MNQSLNEETGHHHELDLKFHPLLVIGVLLLPTIASAILLPKEQTMDLLAILLFGIAAIYVGVSLSSGKWSTVIIQSVVAIVFLNIAALGLWVSPLFLVA